MDVGPSAAPKGKKKTSKRAKKPEVVSPAIASSEKNGSEADDESDHPPPPQPSPPKKSKSSKKKPGQEGIRIQEPVAASTARETIDMTNLVTDPPLATATPVSTRKTKPSAA